MGAEIKEICSFYTKPMCERAVSPKLLVMIVLAFNLPFHDWRFALLKLSTLSNISPEFKLMLKSSIYD